MNKKISDLSFELPKGVVWIDEENVVMNWNAINAICEETWLSVTLIIENNEVISFDCESMVKSSKRCLSSRWPTICSIKFEK